MPSMGRTRDFVACWRCVAKLTNYTLRMLTADGFVQIALLDSNQRLTARRDCKPGHSDEPVPLVTRKGERGRSGTHSRGNLASGIRLPCLRQPVRHLRRIRAIML